MLTVYSLGFVVYPYSVSPEGAHTCPFIAVPTVPRHQCFVIVDGVAHAIDSNGQHTVVIDGQGTNGPLAAAPARIKQQALVDGLPQHRSAQSSWENLDLIPDVELFMQPPTLRGAWMDDLLFRMELLGGELTAIPDRWTLAKLWRWPNGHSQPVTSLTRYRVPSFESGHIVIDSGTPITLGPDSTIHVLNFVPTLADSDLDRYVRGLDHHVAILALSRPQAEVAFTNPLTNVPLSIAGVTNDEYVHAVSNAVSTAKAAGAVPGVTGAMGVSIEAGYPSCAGRTIKWPQSR